MRQSESRRKQIESLSKLMEVIAIWVAGKSLGLEGTGILLVALVMFLVFWSLTGEHLPEALGRIIRIRKQKGQYKSIIDIRQMALVCQLVLGGVGAVIFLFAGPLLGEKVFGCAYCNLMFWILTPVLFLRGLTALLMGYFYGEGSDLPAMIAVVARQIIILGCGLLFGSTLGEYGHKVSALLKQERYIAMYMAVGWCLAIALAEILVLLYLLLSFFRLRSKKDAYETESMRAKSSYSGYIGAICQNMLFKSLISLCERLPIFAGMLIFFKREGEAAAEAFGGYFIGYLAVCLTCLYVIEVIAAAFWSKIYGFIKRDEKRLAKTCFQGGMHLVFALGVILAVTISVMSQKVGAIAGYTSPFMQKVLVPGSFWIVFMALAFYFSGMLQRLGKNGLAFGMAGLSNLVFLMIYLILWTDERMGLLALMYGCLISSGVYAALLGAFTVQILSVRIFWLTSFVIPAITAGIVGAIEMIADKLMGNYFGNLPVVLAVGLICFMIFWCALIAMRNFKEEDLGMMPFGKVLLFIGKMMSVF